MEPNDPILADIRAGREEHAKEFNFDVRAIGEDLMRRQRESGKKYVLPPAKASPIAVQLPLPVPAPAIGAEPPRQSH